MILQVEELDQDKWAYLSENAHKIAFGKMKPAHTERIDYALIVRTTSRGLLGYITCREHDSETVYWQFGGAFPGTKSTSLSFKAYAKCAEFCKERYKRITTVIQNDNIVMLKFAMKLGFRVVGVRTFQGNILLELLLEFGVQ